MLEKQYFDFLKVRCSRAQLPLGTRVQEPHTCCKSGSLRLGNTPSAAAVGTAGRRNIRGLAPHVQGEKWGQQKPCPLGSALCGLNALKDRAAAASASLETLARTEGGRKGGSSLSLPV